MGEKEEGARRKRKRDEKGGQERKSDLFLECDYPISRLRGQSGAGNR